MYWVSALSVGVFRVSPRPFSCGLVWFGSVFIVTAVFFLFVGGYPVSGPVLFVSPASVCLFLFSSEGGFDSPAKLASPPHMRVLPHFGGTFYFPFMLSLGSMDIALRPLCRLKHKKTYLPWEVLRSRRQSSQGEALSLHLDRVDPCDYPKCG